jgi:HEPN domain-containing protein
MSEKIIQNWYSLAKYDLESAEMMLKSGRYLYVAFLCQQTIEKTLKGLFVKETLQTPPYTHNLRRLAKQLSFYENLDQEQLDRLDRLNVYYIESRYTETLEEMKKAIGSDEAHKILKECREMIKWLEAYKK